MNSPRDWGDDPDFTPSYSAAQRGCAKRVMFGFVGLVSIVALIYAGWTLTRDPESWLAESRELLAGVPESVDAVEVDAKAREAEVLLRRYLRSGAKQASTAKLLLSAARCIHHEFEEMQRLVGNLPLHQCERRDLLIAGRLFLRFGQPVIANALVDELLSRGTPDAAVWRLAIDCRYDAGRSTEALRYCHKLASLEPQDADNWLTIAMIYEARSAWQEIIEPLQKHIALSAENTDRQRVQLVRYLVKNRRIRDARKALDQLRINAPEMVARHSLVEAMVLHAEGEMTEAIGLLQSKPTHDEADRVEAMKLTAKIWLAQSKPEQMIAPLQAATRQDPSDHESHYLLGQAYARLDDAELAEKHMTRQRYLLDLKKKIRTLERQAEQELANVAIRMELAELCREVGWPELGRQWQQSATIARSR